MEAHTSFRVAMKLKHVKGQMKYWSRAECRIQELKNNCLLEIERLDSEMGNINLYKGIDRMDQYS